MHTHINIRICRGLGSPTTILGVCVCVCEEKIEPTILFVCKRTQYYKSLKV